MTRHLLLLSLLTLGACSALAPDHAADRQAIVDGEMAWGKAFVTGDAVTVQRLLADDFQGVDPSGVVYDKAKMLAEVKAGPNSTSDTVTSVVVRFYGDTAIAQGSEHEVGPPPERKERDSIWTDVWVKQNGHWRIEAAEDLTPQA